MKNGDPSANFIGWRYFVESPWSFPLGLNPDFGLSLSRSIVYSDAIPLIAIPLKVFGRFLPDNFHYFGLWIPVIFIMQAVMASKLLMLFTFDKLILALGTALFTCAPVLLYRLMGYGAMHIALSSHFLILMAIYLLIKPTGTHRSSYWLLLLVSSLLIHFYLFVIVGVFWWCSMRHCLVKKKITARAFTLEMIAGIVLVLAAGWLSGYFVGGGVGTEGYGFYRMNLLSLFDASEWSYILPNIDEGEGDYEGFNYLGLGMIVAFFASLYFLLSERTALPAPSFWQAFPFVALTLFAITYHVGFGAYSFVLPFPAFLDQYAGILRASGRMFWPAYYILMLGILFVIVKSLSKKNACILLGVVLIFQLADTSTYWASERNPYRVQATSEWTGPLQDPFWEKAAKKYKNVVTTKPGNRSFEWKNIATLGVNHGFATNAIYISRIGQEEVAKARMEILEELRTGNYANNTLYVVHQDDIELVRQNLVNEEAIILSVDGRTVLAPGWQE